MDGEEGKSTESMKYKKDKIISLYKCFCIRCFWSLLQFSHYHALAFLLQADMPHLSSVQHDLGN